MGNTSKFMQHSSSCEFSSVIILHLLVMTDLQLPDFGSDNKPD